MFIFAVILRKSRFSSNSNHKKLLIIANGQNREILTVFTGVCREIISPAVKAEINAEPKMPEKSGKEHIWLTDIFSKHMKQSF